MKVKITRQHDAVKYYGHGKLLITGEYFVLNGAKALAVPSKLGQQLKVQQLHSNDNIMYWVALNSEGKPWLNLVFDTNTFDCINADTPEAKRLSNILTQARLLNPNFLIKGHDLAVETKLEFPNQWGLGSSSTLIYCISQWAGVDGYTLLQQTLGGSGYDVAIAGHDEAIIYTLQDNKPQVVATNWVPPFKQYLYFVYTGKKQISADAIVNYKAEVVNKEHTAAQLTRITEQVLKCTEPDNFEQLMNEHELIVGAALRQIKVKDSLFADYWGSVKSLGAWGGDFVLVTNTKSADELKTYMQQRNINTVFAYDELIIT